MELNGCRVLVTGASGGIGEALVEQLCKAGAQVLAVGRDADKLAAAQGRFPHALRALVADLATPAGVDAVAAAARDFGGVDCVVQAAGLNRFGLVEQQDDEAIAAQVALNLVAPMLLSRRLLPLLRERPRAEQLPRQQEKERERQREGQPGRRIVEDAERERAERRARRRGERAAARRREREAQQTLARDVDQPER